MNQQLGLILGISSLITMGLGSAISKIPSKTLGPNRLMFWRGIIMSFILFVCVLFTGQFASFSWKYALITAMISFFGYWPLYSFYQGLRFGKVGIVSPVSSVYTIFTTILAIIFYKERFSAVTAFSIAIIIFGIILISINFRDFKSSEIFKKSSGIYYAILTAIGWGIYFFLIKIPITHVGSVLFSYMEETFMLVMVTMILLFGKEKVEKPTLKIMKPVTALSVFSVIGVMTYYQGIKIYTLGIMTAIAAAGPLVVCIYGAFVYKEKLELKQYAGILAIILGIVLIKVL